MVKYVTELSGGCRPSLSNNPPAAFSESEQQQRVPVVIKAFNALRKSRGEKSYSPGGDDDDDDDEEEYCDGGIGGSGDGDGYAGGPGQAEEGCTPMGNA